MPALTPGASETSSSNGNSNGNAKRRLTDEEIRRYLAERGAAAAARLQQWDSHGVAARLLPLACTGAQVRKGGKGYAQDPATQPPRQPPPTTKSIPVKRGVSWAGQRIHHPYQ